MEERANDTWQKSNCIPWSGSINPSNGYGRLRVNGRTVMAHRFVWSKERGEIPKGKVIDHLCRNRICVNVEHMEIVTIRENVLRGVGPSAQAARKTHCPKGHPYSGWNLMLVKRGRVCRECNRFRQLTSTISARKALSKVEP